ncbi:MAG TPA: hypothetical protein DFS52_02235 [Myxococcales bacterium]|jgi:alpha-beta hydrolase superfamily lysophospholipase|nr:hypothetical protein [Myxococcales bacterium]
MRTIPSVLRPWNRWYPLAPNDAELLEVTARDGLRLTVRRLAGDGPAVMLLHGLAANRYTFHFPERSLAQWLADTGYDVYVPELRGHGTSERRGWDWGLDEYLQHDLPAIVETILRVSGRDRIHWVGHSMGGILLFCYGILFPEAPIASGLALGSALDYRIGGNVYQPFARLGPLVAWAKVFPYGTLIHLLAPALGRAATGLVDRANVWPSNIEPELNRRFHANGFHSVPTSLLVSLGTTFEPRGLRLRDGSVHFIEQAQRFKVPVRLLAGSKDQQVSPDAVRATAELLGAGSELRVFGREQGEIEEYGHCDLVLGRHAPWEVWPDIEAWLDKNDRSEQTETA